MMLMPTWRWKMEAADASDDVNVNKVTSIKAVTEKHDVDDGDDDDDDDDAHYRMLIREKEQEEERLVDDTVAMEAAAISEDALGEMIGPTHATDEQLNQMRSMYVKDENGVLHHKRTLLKLINNRKGLGKKSHDRDKRARGDARHGNGARRTSDSYVKRAFRFARDHNDIDSGTNHQPLKTSAACWLKAVQR
jgi:hypothetical protein